MLHKANTAQVSVSEWEGNQSVELRILAVLFGIQLTLASESRAFKVHDKTSAGNPTLLHTAVDSGLVGATVTPQRS